MADRIELIKQASQMAIAEKNVGNYQPMPLIFEQNLRALYAAAGVAHDTQLSTHNEMARLITTLAASY